MEIIGKLIRVLPEQSGESARGRWVRGGFVIETSEQYPRMVAFTMFGEDKVAMIKGIAIGTINHIERCVEIFFPTDTLLAKRFPYGCFLLL